MNNIARKIKPCPNCRTSRWVEYTVEYVNGVRAIECLLCRRRVESRLWDIESVWDKWRNDEQVEEV